MILLRINSLNDVLVESGIAVAIVFLALALLVFAFVLTGKISIKASAKRMVKRGKTIEEAKDITHASADEIAAISMALHLFLDDVHDKESNVITIKRIERRYSPWNSKIYGFTNLNR
ncbi:MAG: OadG family protein [Prevotellaceae bacterium]|jgi:Na+-transporting methylmalonyl-CoA/oxaloacetate decarboxylase gamma subunit|nr:OadG family protein [Prevotellaceae bacterium]